MVFQLVNLMAWPISSRLDHSSLELSSNEAIASRSWSLKDTEAVSSRLDTAIVSIDHEQHLVGPQATAKTGDSLGSKTRTFLEFDYSWLGFWAM
jgi:hypothetical protein